jgi:hypothetical protein
MASTANCNLSCDLLAPPRPFAAGFFLLEDGFDFAVGFFLLEDGVDFAAGFFLLEDGLVGAAVGMDAVAAAAGHAGAMFGVEVAAAAPWFIYNQKNAKQPRIE